MSQIEKQIQNKILTYLNDFLPDSFAVEYYAGGLPARAFGSRIIYKKKTRWRPTGFPDLIWWHKGTCRLIEVKTNSREAKKKGYLSKEQKELHEKLIGFGIEVLIIRSLSEIREYCETLPRT